MVAELGGDVLPEQFRREVGFVDVLSGPIPEPGEGWALEAVGDIGHELVYGGAVEVAEVEV
jgi:hypothetical protein